MPDIVKNLDWARTRLARRVHYNQFEADEAFSGPASDPFQVLDDALNEAGTEILNEMGTFTHPDYFKVSQQIVWPTNVVEYTLADGIDRISLIEMRDITMGFPGVQVRPSFGYDSTSEIYWSNINKVTWGVQGPPTDKTILWTWVGGWKVMKDPLDEPKMIPYKFRDLWPWRAAILLREEVDEDNIPQSWYKRSADLEFAFRAEVNQRAPGGSYNFPTKSAILP